MVKKILIILFILSNFISCKKDENDFLIYTIQQGEHSSGIHYGTLQKGKIKFECKFNETAIYDLKNSNQLDINKLYGFSDCNDQHHENSVRFGWRWDLITKKILIYAYYYNNGNRFYDELGSVNPNETHNYEIQLHDKNYLFIFDGKELYVNRTNNCNIGIYYRLYPYFGGDELAPHTIQIYIKEIN